MILLFVIATILLQGYVMGCFAYCGAKIYRLPHLPPRWAFYVAMPFFVVALFLLILLVTSLFVGRPAYIVWWTVFARLAALVILAGGISLPTLFFFGWINGVGDFAPKSKDEPKQ